MAYKVEKCSRSVEVVLVLLLKMLHDVLFQFSILRQVCVCAVIIHGKKKTLLAGLLRPTLPMVCARAVKPGMRISESMLVADPSGWYIWLPEIPNLLPRHRMSVQCMYS